MKAKFDRIMSNFVEENNTKASKNDERAGITEFKNKNLENNMKGIFMNKANS